MKKILIAEYTDELNSIFTENKEAIYFRDTEELLNKLEKIFTNQDLIEEIQNKLLEKFTMMDMILNLELNNF